MDFILVYLLIEYTSYMSCFSLLAWKWERQTGRDAFSLICAIALGAYAACFFYELLCKYDTIAVVAGGAVSTFVFLLIEFCIKKYNFSLLEVLFVVVFSLLLFDGTTEHIPMAIRQSGHETINFLFIISVAVWLWVIFSASGIDKIVMRLAPNDCWIASYWRQGMVFNRSFNKIYLFLFAPIIGIPLLSTGLLSSTILKDAALAILLARVIGARSPLYLLVFSFVLGLSRFACGYLINNNIGPPMVELVTFLGAVLWIRRSGFRAVFSGGESSVYR